MLKITEIKRHGNDVHCHGEQGGVNAVSFDMVVSAKNFKVKRLNVEPCFATGMALCKVRNLVKEYGMDNLPSSAISAWG